MPTARRIAALLGALFILFVGLMAGSVGILTLVAGPGVNRLTIVTFAGSMLALALGLALPLSWQAIQALRGAGSAPFRPRRVWGLAALLAAALVAGQLVLASGIAPEMAFPPLYVAAAGLPPLIVVGLAGRALGGRTRWREIIVQLSSGAFGSTLVAFVFEIGAVLGLIVVAAVVLVLVPGGLEWLQVLSERLQNPVGVQDPAFLARLARSPLVIAAVLAVLSGIVPLIEEAVKTLGVALLVYRRPSQAQALLWGLAGGAGFALAEGLLNSATDVENWLVVALSRVGATLLHCFTGALMGLAWHHLLLAGRWRRFVGLYASSVAIHAAWNALATGLTFTALRTGTAATDPGEIVANSALLAIVGGLVLLAGLVTAGLAAMVWRMRHVE